MRRSHCALLLLSALTVHGQPDTLIAFDRITTTIDTILPVWYDTTITYYCSGSSVGTLGNIEPLDLAPPTSNLFIGAQFSQLVPTQQLHSVSAYPMRTAATVLFYENGTVAYNCSGILVGPSHVFTAGSCLYDQGMWQGDSVVVIPAYDNGMPQLFAGSRAVREYIPIDVLENPVSENFGLLELEEPLGDELGWVGLAFATDTSYYAGKVFHKFSYPEFVPPWDPDVEYNGDTMYYNYGQISYIMQGSTGFLGVLSTEATGMPGQTGSTFLYTDNAKYCAYGTFVYSSAYRHPIMDPGVYHQFLHVLESTPQSVTGNTAQVEGLNIYPNPLTDRTTIAFNNPDRTSCTISIQDSQGRVLRTLTTSENAVDLTKERFSSGVHFVCVRDESGAAAYGKFMVD